MSKPCEPCGRTPCVASATPPTAPCPAICWASAPDTVHPNCPYAPMPVQSISPLDPKQWGGYAHKASPKGVVRFAVGPAGLKPCTTSRLPNWLGRFSVDYMKGQSRQYLTLINAIEQTTSADPSIATDVDVQTAQAELVEQIRSKAELAKSLHWQEITPL